ncbi:Bug family tripartite tricarboxylate transporter substrate binding protein [Pararoseomonas indoligenes]|uniref:Tripartite tricarboxylate transporter substrate binding protein n=1 Tax=Roseomonas indoligenes TaxID=2820811 RepID=A0A940S716_9PROT|nr:tripartite tricarboxylate transporter substrate-binding protein [Pararoseomonas indoligenes]MBP0494594.1 tripartite tricarboxylate transporter substrate binding protein [Pararoseomonas indoligenes]
MIPTQPALGRRALAFGGLGLLTLSRTARAAEAWPTRPVTIVAPFTPGGPVDVLARVIAQGIQAAGSQTAVVDNRTGAQGNIGIDAVRRAAPDGNTLLLVPAGNLTINPTLMRDLTFDVARDFAPISLLATAPNVIVCANDLPVRTIPELVAFAKTQRDGLTYASPGVGSQLHLAGELLAQKTDMKMLHVPYRGSSQALTDVVSGNVQLLFTNLPATLAAIRGGQVRALALTTAARAPAAPEIPTLEELGVGGFDITSWYGLLAPKAVPGATQTAIYEAIRNVLHAPATRTALEAQGLTVTDEGLAEFGTRIRRETATWAEVIRSRNIQSGL